MDPSSVLYRSDVCEGERFYERLGLRRYWLVGGRIQWRQMNWKESGEYVREETTKSCVAEEGERHRDQNRQGWFPPTRTTSRKTFAVEFLPH